MVWNKCNIDNVFIRVYKIQKRFMSVKRKYPINREEAKKLPIFEYNVSKENYKRVFAWGNIHTGALAIPIKKNEDNKLPTCIWFPKRIGFGERNEVTTAACGFGFTVFAVNTDTEEKLYGTGINTDCQIGYHDVRHNKPLEVLFYPKSIFLPFKNLKKSRILKISAGRAHVVVLTDEGVYTFGNNAYGQCGRKIVPNENYALNNYIHYIPTIEDKIITDVECGQDHSLALTKDGCVYSCGWGADGQTGQGHYQNSAEFTRVKGDIESEKIVKLACRSDFVLALNDKGEVFGWGNAEYNQITLPNVDQQLSIPRHINMLERLGPIQSIASGGSFCVVVNKLGDVFSWGYGLLGAGPDAQQSTEPVHIPAVLFGKNNFQPNTEVKEVVCGLYHAAAVTNFGDVYVWGRNKSGCLGLGHEKDQYFPLKIAMGGLVRKVFCGVDHTIAICEPFI